MTVKGDYKALDALLADDLIYVHSNGNVDNEKTFLEGLTSGRSKYHSIEPIDMKARALGDLVFIDGRAKVKVESNGQVNDLLLTYLDVWAKRNGTWQMVHWHSARMPPPAPPVPPAPPAPPRPRSLPPIRGGSRSLLPAAAIHAAPATPGGLPKCVRTTAVGPSPPSRSV